MVGDVDVKDEQGDPGVTIDFNPGLFVGVDGVVKQIARHFVFFKEFIAFVGEGLKDRHPVTVVIKLDGT